MAISTGVDRLASPRYELVPPRIGPPERTYMICSTARSGSTLLSLALVETGELGLPFEYFNTVIRDVLVGYWGSGSDFETYLSLLHSRRSTRNGVFGVKTHWHQLYGLSKSLGAPGAVANPYELSADFLEPSLPGCRFVRILRDDLVGQAISFFLAKRTNRWARFAWQPAEDLAVPDYDFEAIDRFRRFVEAEEVGWDRFFRHNGIDPWTIIYEDLVADLQGTVARLGQFLGAQDVTVGRPEIEVQRTEVSERYRERYLRERQERGCDDPGWLDQPCSGPQAVR